MTNRLLKIAALVLAAASGAATANDPDGKTAEQFAQNPNVVARPATTSQDYSNAVFIPSGAAVARNPRVLFIRTKDCERCDAELARLRKPGGVFDYMKKIGWKIGETPDNHIQIVDRDAIPSLVERLKIREYPTVACINQEEILRSFKEGCTTPLDGWTFGWLMKGINERPGSSRPEAALVEHTGSYPLRGNHWTIDGDWTPSKEKLIHHLRGPNHGHQITAHNYQIETWSYEELRSVHDDLHEQEMGGVSGSGFANYQAPVSTGSGFEPSAANRKFLGR